MNKLSELLEAVTKTQLEAKDKAISSLSKTPVKEEVDLAKIAKKLSSRALKKD